MTRQFKLYPQAETDFEDIWHYTVKTWNVDQAIKYVDHLDYTFQLLANTPLVCRERTELNPPTRIHHCRHHLILYREINNGIAIVRVLHKSMDYEAILGAK